MRGIDVSDDLIGYLSSGPDYVNGDMLRGTVTAGGGYSGSLDVQSLTIGAQIPIADATTYWKIYAVSADGEPICAWSSSASCDDDSPLF